MLSTGLHFASESTPVLSAASKFGPPLPHRSGPTSGPKSPPSVGTDVGTQVGLGRK